MSPECSQPSTSDSAVLSGCFKYPWKTLPPRQITSPSSARATSQPGMAGPTVPGRILYGVQVIGPDDSDMP